MLQLKPPLKPRKKKVEKRRNTAEDIEDRKFLARLEFEADILRIEREANGLIHCPNCYSQNWYVHRRHRRARPLICNDLYVTMTCRKCGKLMPFATALDPTAEEEEDQ